MADEVFRSLPPRCCLQAANDSGEDFRKQRRLGLQLQVPLWFPCQGRNAPDFSCITVGVDWPRVPKSSTDSRHCDVIGRQAGGDAPQVVRLLLKYL